MLFLLQILFVLVHLLSSRLKAFQAHIPLLFCLLQRTSYVLVRLDKVDGGQDRCRLLFDDESVLARLHLFGLIEEIAVVERILTH